MWRCQQRGPQRSPRYTNSLATEAGRGGQKQDWPLGEIVNRGYALAAFYSGDVDPDRGDVSSGVYEWLAEGDPGRNHATNRGTLPPGRGDFTAVWTTSSRAATSIPAGLRPWVIRGTARQRCWPQLWMSASESLFPRPACGGSAPSRGKIGESVKPYNHRFPHWFNSVV